MNKNRFLSLFSLMLIALTGGFSSAPAASSESFSTDPFSGANPRWVATTDDVGTVTWSTTQAPPGQTHSVRIERTGAFNNEMGPRLYTNLENVPQTGLVTLQFFTYMETLPTFVSHPYMHFGETGPAPTHPMCTLGMLGGTLLGETVVDDPAYFTFPNPPGWTRISSPVIPEDQWVRHRAVFNQDAITFSYYIKIGANAEVAVGENIPIGGGKKLGEAGFKPIVSSAYSECIFYIGDMTISAGDFGPAIPPPPPPALSFGSTGTSDTFATDPFAGETPRWSALSSNSGNTVTWTTEQAPPGLTRSVKIVRTTGFDGVMTPRFFTNLQNVPQSGKIQVEFQTYHSPLPTFVSHPNLHFGENVNDPQHPLATFGLLGGTLLGGTVTDQISYFTLPNPPGWVSSTALAPANTWIKHRGIFDQDASSFSYYVQIGNGSEITIGENVPITTGQKLGAIGFEPISSGAYSESTTYFADFKIGFTAAPLNQARNWELY